MELVNGCNVVVVFLFCVVVLGLSYSASTSTKHYRHLVAFLLLLPAAEVSEEAHFCFCLQIDDTLLAASVYFIYFFLHICPCVSACLSWGSHQTAP